MSKIVMNFNKIKHKKSQNWLISGFIILIITGFIFFYNADTFGPYQAHVYVIASDNESISPIKQLTSSGWNTIAYYDVPAYSASRDEIVFGHRDSPNGTVPNLLYVMKPDGTSKKQVTNRGISDPYGWSPDGKWVYGSSGALGGVRIDPDSALGTNIATAVPTGGGSLCLIKGVYYWAYPDGSNISVSKSTDGITWTLHETHILTDPFVDPRFHRLRMSCADPDNDGDPDLFYYKREPASYPSYIYNAVDKKLYPIRITNGTHIAVGHPMVSHDGLMLIGNVDCSKSFGCGMKHLWSMLDGSLIKVLTSLGGWAYTYQPFSLDDKRLVMAKANTNIKGWKKENDIAVYDIAQDRIIWETSHGIFGSCGYWCQIAPQEIKPCLILFRAGDSNGNPQIYTVSYPLPQPNITDNAPPVISNGRPTGTLSADTTSATISATTSEDAACRYSAAAGTGYASMPNTFSTTGGTSHSTTVSGLANNRTYNYYVRCQDAAGNANSDDFTISFSVAAYPAYLPELPRVFLDTSYNPPTGGTLRVVKAGDNLQTVLDTAQPGDIIELQAGANFTGNFILRNKNGSGWIYIRSSAYSSLPSPGNRVNPSHAYLMPKIVSPNTVSAISTEAGAHHYRFVGIEITTSRTGTTGTHYNLVLLYTPDMTSLSQLSTDIIFDRSYIHGNPTGNVRRGIALSSANSAVIDSYISDIHEIGADSQAISGSQGPGPLKIVNNYIEAAGENIMFGGADPTIPNLVPSDIEIRNNHFFKPLKWRIEDPSFAGIKWTVKNLLELKNARRVLIEGNIFEQNWAHAQTGFAILFTARNQGGTAPWSTVEDVTFIKNIVRHTAQGINILGKDQTKPTQGTKHVLIKDNLFEDVDANKWGNEGTWRGFLFQILTEAEDITIYHNTGFQKGAIINAGGLPSPGFIFRNNIVPHNMYGVVGSGVGWGNASLNAYLPGAIFTKNAIYITISGQGSPSKYPQTTFSLQM